MTYHGAPTDQCGQECEPENGWHVGHGFVFTHPARVYDIRLHATDGRPRITIRPDGHWILSDPMTFWEALEAVLRGMASASGGTINVPHGTFVSPRSEA